MRNEVADEPVALSDEYCEKEALTAFVEKRAPDFTKTLKSTAAA